jgi:hypothetical protein
MTRHLCFLCLLAACDARTIAAGDAGACADGDGDGHDCERDCDDRDPSVHPEAAEVCDGTRDDDCDGAVDETCACLDGATRACGSEVGACVAGVARCRAGSWGACEGASGPREEACDGAEDEDCDAVIDEGCACTSGSSRSCGSDTGACRAGTQRCVDGIYGACDGAIAPGVEACDGEVDDDCDGLVDEGCACTDGDSRDCGIDAGACEAGAQTCAGGAWGSCDGAIGPSAEVCDGAIDESCDGRVDEGCACTNGAARACGIDEGACVAGVERCAAGAWGACDAIGPSAEVCDGAADEDCDGVIDEGCACGPNERRCGGACRPCPTAGVASTACAASACVAASCSAGYSACGASCCPIGPTWREPETITTTRSGTYLYFPSVVARGGVVHATWWYSGAEHVSFYGRRSGSAWTVSDPEDSAPSNDAWPVLAVDASGDPHVVYYAEPSGTLRYARGASGGTAWAFRAEHVSTAGPGSFPAIAIDSAGRLHVANRFNTSGYLAYNVRGASTWAAGPTLGDGVVGELASLAIDALDGVHAVFHDARADRLLYAHLARGGTRWDVSAIEPTPVGTDSSSVAVGADGVVHVAYARGDQLWYARRSSGSWTRTSIDTRPVGRWPSIGVDRAGRVHIAYHDAGARHLRYATDRDGVWRTSLLAVDGNDQGGPRSLHVGADDRVHVVYYASGARALRYLAQD